MILLKESISIKQLLETFPEIDDINYKQIILVFTEGYSQEEYDQIHDLLANKWQVNKLHELNKLIGKNGSGIVYEHYSDDYSLIKRRIILVENCDLYEIYDAYDLYEYLDMDYRVYVVRPEIALKED